MCDLNEARKKLLAVLDKDKKEKYFQLLRSSWVFKSPLSKLQFNAQVSKILRTPEELRAHNQFIYASLCSRNMNYLRHTARAGPTEKGCFEQVNATDYIEQNTSTNPQLGNLTERTAVSEYFFPDIGFVTNRIAFQAWENGLDGCEKHVPEYIANLCQTFIKNILTAMISKKESYKIRDKHFQYGFGLPSPNILLRNTHKIIDRTKESKLDLTEEEDSFLPAFRPSIDVMEQETAFNYACGRRTYSGGKLTAQLLYDTLRDNPHVVGLHSIHSTNLLKLGLQLED